MLDLGVKLKDDLVFLAQRSTQSVLQDFCKLMLDFAQKGPNLKLYAAVAQKLQVEPQVIRDLVEGLLNFFVVCCKAKLRQDDFKKTVLDLGFSEEQEALLYELYSVKKEELVNAMANFDVKLQRYHNLEWRFETQIASRSLLQQVVPLITLNLSLKNTSDSKNIEHVLLQTDPNNLMHLVQELEIAVREGTSRYTRNIERVVN